MSYIDTARKVNDTVITRMVDGNIRVENAVLMFRNFSGNPTNFNPQGGKRTFSLCLPKEWADILKQDLWNVKERQLDDGEVIYHTEIVVNENSQYPPHLYLLSEFMGKKAMTLLQPEQYKKLDQDMIVGLDLEIHPFEHGRGTPGSKKGYLKNLWATLQSVNDFGGKYADYEMAGTGV
jgi:hypothetical protein